jgi:hypothetical protein
MILPTGEAFHFKDGRDNAKKAYSYFKMADTAPDTRRRKK